MRRNDFWIRGLLVAVLAACSAPDDEPCAAVCGEGFTCQNQRCEVDPTATIGAEILLPEPSTVSAMLTSAFSCRARAPQLRGVEMHLASGGAVLTVALDPEGNTGVYVGTARLSEGEWTATCRVTFGPEGFERTSDSLERVFLLDRAAPTITITPITTWQSRSGTTTVTAKIVDQGGTATKKAGIDGPTVKLVAGGKTYPGTSGAGDTWTFAVSPAEITTNTIEGELEFTVSAADKAGNEASETATMNVDASGPTAAMTVPATWIKRDAAAFTVAATATSTGAGVSSVTLTGAGGTPSLVGVLQDDTYQFEITPSHWQSANAETPVPWTLVAVDEAGNEATQEGVFNIDGKGPTLTANVPTDWVGGTHYELSVTASDAASGLVESSVKWSAGGANGDCAKESAGQYVCIVALATPVGSVNPSYEVTLSADDLLGNASQSKVVLKVDRKGPTVSVESDGKWYGRGETVTVKVSASDSDAGLGGATFFRTTAPKASSTGGTIGASGVTFEVQAADVAPANATTTSLTAEVEICDGVGNCTKVPANDLFKVDDQAPTITLGNDLTYLSGKGMALRRDPAGGDRAKVTFSATVTDAGSGVASQDVRLAFTGADGNPKEIAAKSSVGGGVYAFEFDAKEAQFNAGVGNIELRVVAKDVVGVEGTSAVVPVATTRELWTYTPPKGAPVNAAVALANERVYFTLSMNDSSAHNVFSVKAVDGSYDWSVKLDGTPKTPVVVGDDYLYFAYSGAGNRTWVAKYLLDSSVERALAWSCTLPSGGFGSIWGGLALADLDVDGGGTSEEVVVALNGGARIYVVYGNCQNKSLPLAELVSNGGGIPSVDGDRIWIGGDSGVVATVRYEEGGFSVPLYVDLGEGAISGVPLMDGGNATVVRSGALDELDGVLDSVRNVSVPSFLRAVVAPPIVSSFGNVFWGSDDGYLFGVSPGASSGIATAMPEDPRQKVKGSPVVDVSERVYLVTEDGVVRAYLADGSALWTFDTGSAGVVSSSPALSCSGVLFVGTSSGEVVALIADAGLDSDASWPKYQHDNRNTGNRGTSNACPPAP